MKSEVEAMMERVQQLERVREVEEKEGREREKEVERERERAEGARKLSESLGAQLQICKDELNTAKSNVQRLTGELKASEKKATVIVKLQRENDKLKKDLEEQQNANKEADGKLKQLERRQASLIEKEIAKTREECAEEFRCTRGKYEDQILELQESLQDALDREARAGQEAERLQERCAELGEKLKSQSSAAAAVKARSGANDANTKRLEDELKKASKTLEMAKRAHQKEVSSLKGEVTRLKSELAAAASAPKTEKQVQVDIPHPQQQQRVASLQSELASKNAVVQEMHRKKQEMKASYESRIKELESAMDVLRKQATTAAQQSRLVMSGNSNESRMGSAGADGTLLVLVDRLKMENERLTRQKTALQELITDQQVQLYEMSMKGNSIHQARSPPPSDTSSLLLSERALSTRRRTSRLSTDELPSSSSLPTPTGPLADEGAMELEYPLPITYPTSHTALSASALVARTSVMSPREDTMHSLIHDDHVEEIVEEEGGTVGSIIPHPETSGRKMSRSTVSVAASTRQVVSSVESVVADDAAPTTKRKRGRPPKEKAKPAPKRPRVTPALATATEADAEVRIEERTAVVSAPVRSASKASATITASTTRSAAKAKDTMTTSTTTKVTTAESSTSNAPTPSPQDESMPSLRPAAKRQFSRKISLPTTSTSTSSSVEPSATTTTTTATTTHRAPTPAQRAPSPPPGAHSKSKTSCLKKIGAGAAAVRKVGGIGGSEMRRVQGSGDGTLRPSNAGVGGAGRGVEGGAAKAVDPEMTKLIEFLRSITKSTLPPLPYLRSLCTRPDLLTKTLEEFWKQMPSVIHKDTPQSSAHTQAQTWEYPPGFVVDLPLEDDDGGKGGLSSAERKVVMFLWVLHVADSGTTRLLDRVMKWMHRRIVGTPIVFFKEDVVRRMLRAYVSLCRIIKNPRRVRALCYDLLREWDFESPEDLQQSQTEGTGTTRNTSNNANKPGSGTKRNVSVLLRMLEDVDRIWGDVFGDGRGGEEVETEMDVCEGQGHGRGRSAGYIRKTMHVVVATLRERDEGFKESFKWANTESLPALGSWVQEIVEEFINLGGDKTDASQAEVVTDTARKAEATREYELMKSIELVTNYIPWTDAYTLIHFLWPQLSDDASTPRVLKMIGALCRSGLGRLAPVNTTAGAGSGNSKQQTRTQHQRQHGRKDKVPFGYKERDNVEWVRQQLQSLLNSFPPDVGE
ncbi:hypothetical protein HK102_010686 [Quaeritorhiza haematococci]|nr:hypothetical protein HK102_010686 [Quaeritorhiza haematococci]